MGELFNDLVSQGQSPRPVYKPQGHHPQGWEPGLVMEGESGTLQTGPLTRTPNDWNELLAVWGLDPEKYEVIEPVQYRAWDANIGGGEIKRMFYYRARIQSRLVGGRDVEEIFETIKHYKARRPDVTSGELAFVWCIADLQIGKGDGDGTPGTVQRFLDGIAAIKKRVADLRQVGRSIGTLYVAGLGDCVENIAGHYATQTFATDLNMTEQVRVIRRLIVRGVFELAPLFDRVVMLAVPGNHGEAVRHKGKAITPAADNWDVECFTAAYEVISQHPDFGHVSLFVPEGNNLDLTVDMAGTIVTLAHGHQFPAGNSKMCGAQRWWADQAHGMQQPGESTLLLSGHLHHFKIERTGFKTYIQAPSLDGGSEWWRNLTGSNTPPGILTLVVGDGNWQDLEIL